MNIIHLSDIHFHNGSGGVWDLNKDLRHQLELDLERVVGRLGTVDAVVVTGDIAFSADRKQFETALEWLESVADLSGCPRENIWVTPGNHDVDRSVAGSLRVSDARAALRKGRRSVDEVLADGDYGTTFFEALREYNHFAANFSCQIGPDTPTWLAELPLNDGSHLALCGLNTTLVSGPDDDEATGRMVVGPVLPFLPELPDRIYMTLAHHPLPWLQDGGAAHADLQARAAIQLFGHTHAQVVDRIGNSVRIVAGATHPSRMESDWLPRYNALSLAVCVEEDRRWLDVALHSRVWKNARRCFGACTDRVDASSEQFRLPLPWWAPAEVLAPGNSPDWSQKPADLRQSISENGAVDQDEASPLQSAKTTQRRPAVDPYRALVRHFLYLPVHCRYQVMVTEGLLSRDSEPPPPSNPAWVTALSSARSDRATLARIWSRTQELLGKDEANPFEENKHER